ncbi:hypothetical protein KQ51_00353 [Candidatus Izimaplasma bacterium HR1]|jgi:hypothetical protein|uniref:immunoglobulin-like domain-containing protein n=1 Tax=Candidatus Izimoplasma sp. HR1 TaxID=1541959 RepID=UPI0004F591F7|nr:hypothetical protein KQ51_00353 [Candidatus Izimaplasma bacterium HR1]
MKKVLTLLLVFTLGLTLASCTDQEAATNVADAAQKLSLEVSDPTAVTSDITLPTEGLHESTISWESDNAAISAAGVVTRPAIGSDDVTVILTATFTIGKETTTKEFTFKVLAAVPSVAVTAAVFESSATAVGDVVELTGIVVGLVKTYGYEIYDGTGFTYVNEFQDPTVSIGDEVTVMGEKGIYNNGSELVEIQSTVVNSTGNALPNFTETTIGEIFAQDPDTTDWYHDMFNAEGVIVVQGDYDNAYLSWFDQDLNLRQMEIYYKSYDDAKLAAVKALEGKKVELDFILKDYSYGSFRLTVNSTGEVNEATIYTDAERAKLAVAYNDLFFNSLGDEVVASLDLPTDSDFVTKYDDTEEANMPIELVWTSSNEVVIANDGTVTLPVGATADVELTVTATVGDVSAHKTYTVTVADADTLTTNTVAEVIAMEDGETVIVEAIVSGLRYGNPFVQDADGTAMFIYTKLDVKVGDKVWIQGELATFSSYGNALKQLTRGVLVKTVSTGNALTYNTTTTAAELAAAINTMHSDSFTMTLKFLEEDFGYYFFEAYVDGDDADNNVRIKMDTDWFPTMETYLDGSDMIEISFVLYDVHYDEARIVPVAFPGLTNADRLDIVKGMIALEEFIVLDVNLLTYLPTFDAAITWVSANTAMDAEGNVTRPVAGEDNVEGDLTASIVIGSDAAVDEVYTVTVVASPTDAMTVAEVYAAGYSDYFGDYTHVYVTGVVAGLTDDGYVIQDTVSGKFLVVEDFDNEVEVGQELNLEGFYNASYEVIKLRDVFVFMFVSEGNALNLELTDAVAMDWATFDRNDYQTGELIAITAPWATLYSGDTSYLRLGNGDGLENAKSFDGKYVGLQNGANELNLTGTLADIFDGGQTSTEYADVTIYVLIYDTTSSYNKFIILSDDFIVVTP